MNADLSTIEFWLAVLAVIAVVQFVLLVAVAMGALRLARRVGEVLDDVSRRVGPVVTRADAVLDDLQRVVSRVEATEASVRGAVSRVTTVASTVRDVFWRRTWPVRAIARGLQAVFSPAPRVVTRSGGWRPEPVRDRLDVARFVNEGGALPKEE
jgi:hypothetical protein